MRWPRSDPDAYDRCDSHGRSVPDVGKHALVTAILPQKNGRRLVGIHFMVSIVLAIANTLLFRWNEPPSTKLDELLQVTRTSQYT